MIDEKAVAVINNEALSVKHEAQALEIVDDVSAQRANDILVRAKSWVKKTKAERDAVLKPVKDSVKKITELYATGLSVMEEVADIIGVKLLARMKAEQARKEAEEKERQAKLAEIEAAQKTATAADAFEMIAEKEAIVAAPVEEKKTVVRSDYGSSGITKRWTYEITNPEMVPRALCVPSAGLIREAVDSGARAIAGVRIFQTESVTTRR